MLSIIPVFVVLPSQSNQSKGRQAVYNVNTSHFQCIPRIAWDVTTQARWFGKEDKLTSTPFCIANEIPFGYFRPSVNFAWYEKSRTFLLSLFSQIFSNPSSCAIIESGKESTHLNYVRRESCRTSILLIFNPNQPPLSRTWECSANTSSIPRSWHVRSGRKLRN